MKDKFGREIEYMRISITDRCNLRCTYCMPEEGIEKVDRSEILREDEILRICRIATGLGIKKFKITGGEPLVRTCCKGLVRKIKELPGCEQVTMTTNGQLLAENLDELADAGIDGINISLDTLKEDRYRQITRTGDIGRTLDAIDACIRRGIKTKINCLLQRGVNDDEIADLAEFALEKGIDIRFIELMPIGFADEDKCVGSDEVMDVLKRAYPDIEPDGSTHGNGPAVYYRVPGRSGGIGLISSIHGRFCSGCNRIRLTSMGFVKPCLCYDDGIYLKPYLAGTDNELAEELSKAVQNKPKQHCFENVSAVDHHAMAEIGG
ncbi:MAG: GTP 3',8-cyclase MoaA [Mogibacterium sp.]|nr:GTP 3',8-cyclase MoaA [Mogibacterium sp.]